MLQAYGFWFRAGEQRAGVLIQRPGFFCRRVKPLHGVGKLDPGGVLLGDSQLHLHQEDSVGGGGGSGLFL